MLVCPCRKTLSWRQLLCVHDQNHLIKWLLYKLDKVVTFSAFSGKQIHWQLISLLTCTEHYQKRNTFWKHHSLIQKGAVPFLMINYVHCPSRQYYSHCILELDTLTTQNIRLPCQPDILCIAVYNIGRKTEWSMSLESRHVVPASWQRLSNLIVEKTNVSTRLNHVNVGRCPHNNA